MEKKRMFILVGLISLSFLLLVGCKTKPPEEMNISLITSQLWSCVNLIEFSENYSEEEKLRCYEKKIPSIIIGIGLNKTFELCEEPSKSKEEIESCNIEVKNSIHFINDSIRRYCESDENCIFQGDGCCGGEAVNKDYYINVDKVCMEICDISDYSIKCENNICTLRWK